MMATTVPYNWKAESSPIDWRLAVQDARAFDDILNVFGSLFGGKWGFDRYLATRANTKKVREAVAMLELSDVDPEARYFSLSQVQSLLMNSDMSDDEQRSIAAKHKDAFSEKGKELFGHYVSKGANAIASSGIQSAFAEHAKLGEEIKNIEARQTESMSLIEAEIEPRRKEAYDKYVSPLIENMERGRKVFDEKRREILSRRPASSTIPQRGAVLYLSSAEMEEYQKWQDELDKFEAAFADEHRKLCDECTAAHNTYMTPLADDEYDKKMSAFAEIGDPTSLRKEQKAIAEAVHGKLIAFLLDQSPVTEPQAMEWINQNAIMDKRAIAKAKNAGYDPGDVTKDLVEFYRITGGRIPRLSYTTTRNARSMASPMAGNLYVGSNFGKKTFFHELAHLLEGDPKILSCAFEFLAKRRESAETYSLSSLTGNRGYRGDERAYKDKWIDPYVGKTYPNTTEVFSMGISMLSSPEALADIQGKDPEHLSLMLGVCLAKPYIDENRKQLLQGEVREKKAIIQKTDDFYREIDKKIAKAGDFWKSHVDAIEPYTRYGRKKPSSYTIRFDSHPTSQGFSSSIGYFKSEKSMKRALYLWISNGKQPSGPFSMNSLTNIFTYEKSALPKELINSIIPELPN